MDVPTLCKTKVEAQQKRCYTVFEIAQILNISRTSAYELVKNGPFKTIRIGSSIRISKDSFDSWLEN